MDRKTVTSKTAIEAEILEKARSWAQELGGEFLVELIDTYLEDTPQRMAGLRRALDARDLETSVREAHTLKSSCANLGASGLSGIAKEMESLGRAGRLDETAEKLAEFEHGYEHVQAALQAARAAHWEP